MSTGLIHFPTVEELRTGYTPTYSSFFGNLMGSAQAYAGVEGTIKSTQIDSIEEITAAKLGMDDTERKQLLTGPKAKEFFRNFFGITYKVNKRQDQSTVQGTSNRVIEKLVMQLDNQIVSGLGNNGLLASSDYDHVITAQNGVAYTTLSDILTRLKTDLKAQETLVGNGPKLLAIYGTAADFLAKLNVNTDQGYLATIGKMLGPNYRFIELPTSTYNSSTYPGGIVSIAEGLVRLNHMDLPAATDVGSNNEKGYNWINYEFGTANLECLQKGAITVMKMLITV